MNRATYCDHITGRSASPAAGVYNNVSPIQDEPVEQAERVLSTTRATVSSPTSGSCSSRGIARAT